MPRIGAHVSIAGGLEKAFARGEELSCEAIQIFTKNQLQWRSAPISQGRAERFLRAWGESSVIDVVVHSSYLINLAATDATGERSVAALEDEIERCDMLGIDNLILHPGSSRGNPVDESLDLVSERLRGVLDRTSHKRVNILLETMSGQGSHLGAEFSEFRRIFENLDWEPRLGLCLDTCHMFAAGLDFRTGPAYRRLLGHIDSAVGIDRVRCWHFNDSVHPLGRRLDRHAHIGEGEIGTYPFSMILADPLWEDIPCILETPVEGHGHGRDIAILRKLRGG